MELIKEIWNQIQLYYSDMLFLIAAIISYIYLAVTDKDTRRRFLYPVGLIMFCVVNPVLYKYVFSKVIFWRLFWMLPDAIIIAYAVTDLIRRVSKKTVKLLIFAATVGAIVCMGRNAFVQADYVPTENWHKIPNEVIEVCDIILATEDEPRCIMPDSLYNDVRQYSGEIEMLYGRNVLDKFIINSNEASKGIYLALREAEPDYDYIFAMSSAQNCNFLVLEKDADEAIYSEYGYEKLAEYNRYYIYYNPSINREEPIGWLVSQYGKIDDNRRTYITIQDGNGGLIIIDGGNGYNAYNIRQQIKSYDNHVTAWIITNPNRVYAEAFQSILEEHAEIVIDDIYTMASDPYDYQQLGREVHYVEEGDKFEAGGLTFEVEYYTVNEKKDYAMMAISMSSESNKMFFYTSINKTEKKRLEELGIVLPTFDVKMERSVFR